jgi:hypothetical protein
MLDKAVKRFRWNDVEFYLLETVHFTSKSSEFAEKVWFVKEILFSFLIGIP